MIKPYTCRTDLGTAIVGPPDSKGLREVTFEGDLIGMIQNTDNGYRIAAAKGKPNTNVSGDLWTPASQILAAHINSQGGDDAQ
ncbi:MAG: hypothetical protein JST51_01605 [Armatimonadetes bacterium]|nr:hypothetical protein [Armatimonadota bacterium]